MRYIQKGASPAFFEQAKSEIQHDPNWNNLKCKSALTTYLIEEQKGLCAYCECGITENHEAHIEHIYHQDGHPDLRFEYQNLVASCNGALSDNHENLYAPLDSHSCGHKKSNTLDKLQFLNPVSTPDIGSRFAYNKTTCEMVPHPIHFQMESSKANYTLGLLNLNNPRLKNARSNARTALQKAIKTQVQHKQANAIHSLLSRERPYISFLRYCFAVL